MALGSGKCQQLYFFRATSVGSVGKHFLVLCANEINFGKPKHMQKFGTQCPDFLDHFG